MITFKGRIVQFGFGAVGKSFFEKLSKEIKIDEYNYFVITRDQEEFEAYVNLGGVTSNFIVIEINKENYKEIFSKYLKEGDLLIDFADSVGTKDFVEWCANRNVMYLNTGEADWPENWYSIFNENELKKELREKHKQTAGIPKARGRKPAKTLQEYKYENKRLKMENELLRDFLSLTERK